MQRHDSYLFINIFARNNSRKLKKKYIYNSHLIQMFRFKSIKNTSKWWINKWDRDDWASDRVVNWLKTLLLLDLTAKEL